MEGEREGGEGRGTGGGGRGTGGGGCEKDNLEIIFLHGVSLMEKKLLGYRCKLPALPGVGLHKLALHYSRAAEPSHPGTRFPGLSVRITECRPCAQQGLGARSARGGR